VLALVAVAILLAVAAGAAILADDGGDPSRDAVRGLAQVTITGGWVESDPAVPGFTGAGASSFAPEDAGGSTSSMTVGTTTPSATSLLPAALLRRLDGPPPRPAIRRRGDAWVFSYAGMRLTEPAGRLTVHLMPTDRGTAGVACLSGPSAPASFAARCKRAAGSLRPAAGARAHSGLSREYAAGLDAAIGSLNRARRAARSSLGPAATPAAARTQALGLERAYSLAARRVRGSAALRGRPELRPANARIATALDRTRRAYAAMAAAATSAQPGALAAARRTVLARERDLRGALRDLAGLGYRPTVVD
jgi:hypothetical protein